MVYETIPVKPEIDIEGFNFLYYLEQTHNFYQTPERHNFWEMLYVDYGSIISVSDGVGCDLSAGQVVFHSPGEIHNHAANQKDASNIVVVGFTCNSPLMSFFDKKVFTLGKASKKILSLFFSEASQALGGLCNDPDNKSPIDFSNAVPCSAQLMMCYWVEFLCSLIRAEDGDVQALVRSKNSRALAESSLVTTALQYMQSHVTDPPSLSVLCEQFSVSRTYLCNAFKEGVGNSPIDCWINHKIKLAKRLIREEERNITQISEYLGYSSIHHFTRMFKRVTGLSPTDYKKSIN